MSVARWGDVPGGWADFADSDGIAAEEGSFSSLGQPATHRQALPLALVIFSMAGRPNQPWPADKLN